jgi:apolipoprotein N-acyltransferase
MTTHTPWLSPPWALLVFRCLLLMGLGALNSLAFTHTSTWWATILCLAGFMGFIRNASLQTAVYFASAYCMGWFLCGVWWIYISLYTYGDLTPVLAAAGLFALCAYMALFYVIATVLARHWGTPSIWSNAIILASLYTLGELLRGYLFTGFPWLSIGYSQVDGPLARWAPWIGVYGISFLTTLIAALLAFGFKKSFAIRHHTPIIVSATLVISSLLLPQNFSRSNGKVSVSLLQPQVDQSVKFTSQHLNNTLNWLQTHLKQSQGAMVITPETVIPLLLKDVPYDTLHALQSSFASYPRAALIGIPIEATQSSYTNSFIAFGGATGSLTSQQNNRYTYRYDKYHLVPFGEFTPIGFQWFSTLLNISLTHFMSGDPSPSPLQALGQKWGPMICFEDLFGEELARRFQNDERAPTILVNGSNLAWFGRTIAIDQHLHIARMRTLEFQRPTVRATNTGTTAIIDHNGAVVSAINPTDQGILEGTVEGRSGLTPYAYWASRWGLWPLTILALAAIALARRRFVQ